ncbi:hypothetical protein C0995_000828 [Termitomyces sp. Mi166|nr:hypothetical protein C0995_000828 [Termitomyces sp. Mi166\
MAVHHIKGLVEGQVPAIAKGKGKKKEKKQEPSAITDKQLATLLQHFHDTGVPEEMDMEALKNSVVQLAFMQVLNKFDTAYQQRYEALINLASTSTSVGYGSPGPSSKKVKKARNNKPVISEAGQGDEDDDRNDEYISKYEYKEIEASNNAKMHHLKKAHNEKVDHKKAVNQQ